MKSKAPSLNIIAASVPVDLTSDVSPELNEGSTPRIHLATTFTAINAKLAKGISSALEKGFVVDIDVQSNLASGEAGWEALEDFIDRASPDAHKGSLVLCGSV